jgi:hypothetical protein
MANLSTVDRRLLRRVWAGQGVAEIARQERLNPEATRTWLRRVLLEVRRGRAEPEAARYTSAHPRTR